MVSREVLIVILDVILLIVFIILGYTIPGFFKMLYPLAIFGGFLILIRKYIKRRKDNLEDFD